MLILVWKRPIVLRKYFYFGPSTSSYNSKNIRSFELNGALNKGFTLSSLYFALHSFILIVHLLIAWE